MRSKGVVVTNLYPGHMHYEPVRLSLAHGGYQLRTLLHRAGADAWTGTAVGQFIFNYPINASIGKQILRRAAGGEHAVVMMDDPLAFFDENINRVIVPVLRVAARVFTSTDNMLPIYRSIDVKAELLVGLANPLFDIAEPVDESSMKFDWGFIGRLVPQRFRFFWQLQRLLPEHSHSIVTKGFDVTDVIRRVRETRVNVAFGNFSDITDFKSNGTTLRAWEFPYAGAFIVHDERPLLERFFREGESIVTFRTVEDCADRIRSYVTQPKERHRIARNARETIQRQPMTSFFPNLFDELLSS
jgi:hypothetical protein